MNLSLLAIAVQAAKNGEAASSSHNLNGHYAVILGFRDTPLAVFVLDHGEIIEVFHPGEKRWFGTEKHRIAPYNVLAEFKPDE